MRPRASGPPDASEAPRRGVALLLLLPVVCSLLLSPSEGRAAERSVRFFVNAKSDFDRWTERPDAEMQAWMRANYDRMLTYSPYFDERLRWYPNAWVYRDIYAIYADSSVATERPEWILRDAGGKPLYIPFGCSRGRCPQYAADFGNPEFRRHWIERLRRIVDRGYIGIWIDDVNLDWRVGDGYGNHVRPIDPRTGAPMLLSDWRRYLAEFTEQVRAEFPDKEIAHNVIWYAAPGNDPFISRQIKAADYINLERGASDSGIRGGRGKYGFETFLKFIDRVHDFGGHVILEDDESDTEIERNYELAAYLLISDGGDLISADGDRERMSPERFWHGYDVSMGAALGPRHSTHDGLIRRDFECGFVLLNQPDKPPRVVRIGEGFRDLDGKEVDKLRLSRSTAAVLLRDECDGG